MSGSSNSRGGRPGPRAGAAGTITAAMLLLSGSAWAAEEPWAQPLPSLGTVASVGNALPRQDLQIDRFEPPALARRAATPAANRFFRGHFVPRVSRQFEEVIPIAPAHAETDFADSVLFATVSETARLQAERGTRKAVKNYLLEVTTLGRTVEAVKIRGRKAPDGGRPEGVRIGVGFAHGLPQVELRRRNGAGTFRFRVDLQGSVGVEFKQVRRRYSRVFVGYDADDDHYNLGCRLSF